MKYTSLVVIVLALASYCSHVKGLSANLVTAANDPMWSAYTYGFLAGRGPTWFGGQNNLTSGQPQYNMNVDRYFENGNQWVSVPAFPTPTSYDQGACAHPDGSKMIVYGGFLFGSNALTASVSIVDSISLDVTVLPPGQGPALSQIACVVTPSNKVYYFGGRGQRSPYSDKTWTTNLVTGVTTIITPNSISPPMRAGHSAVWNGTAMIIFGGSNAQGTLNDMWGYNVTANIWLPILTPPWLPRNSEYLHGVWQNAWYIFGGLQSGIAQYNTIYKFNMATNTFSQVPLTLPAPINRGTGISLNNGIFYLRGHAVSLMRVDLNP